MYACVCICVRTDVHTVYVFCMYVYLCMNACMYVCVCMYVHVRIRTELHFKQSKLYHPLSLTYMHTYTAACIHSPNTTSDISIAVLRALLVDSRDFWLDMDSDLDRDWKKLELGSAGVLGCGYACMYVP